MEIDAAHSSSVRSLWLCLCFDLERRGGDWTDEGVSSETHGVGARKAKKRRSRPKGGGGGSAGPGSGGGARSFCVLPQCLPSGQAVADAGFGEQPGGGRGKQAGRLSLMLRPPEPDYDLRLSVRTGIDFYDKLRSLSLRPLRMTEARTRSRRRS